MPAASGNEPVDHLVLGTREDFLALDANADVTQPSLLGLDQLADPVANLGGLVAGKHLGGDVDNLANLDVRNLRLVLFTRRAEQGLKKGRKRRKLQHDSETA